METKWDNNPNKFNPFEKSRVPLDWRRRHLPASPPGSDHPTCTSHWARRLGGTPTSAKSWVSHMHSTKAKGRRWPRTKADPPATSRWRSSVWWCRRAPRWEVVEQKAKIKGINMALVLSPLPDHGKEDEDDGTGKEDGKKALLIVLCCMQTSGFQGYSLRNINRSVTPLITRSAW